MGFHTFDIAKADRLEDPDRYRWASAEELLDAIDADNDDVVVDLGSGTGFYTTDVAPHVESVYAVDIQAEMHDRYRKKGVPANVELITSGIADLPFGTGDIDVAFSTMTYHEFAADNTIAEVARVLRPGGRLVTFDWSADGSGAAGPPTDDAVTALDAVGFETIHATTRTETFVVIAEAP